MITFVLIDMSAVLVMDSCLSLVDSVVSDSTLISMDPLITSCCLMTSFSSVSLSSKSPSDSFSTENESFKVLDSSSLESVSSSSVVPSR